MGNKKNVPAIRFKGFAKEWKEEQLGDCADIIGGGTPTTSQKEYWDGDIDWYSPAEIGDKVFVDGSKRKITSLGLKESSARILPIGTVLFSSRAGIGSTAILAKKGATNQGFQSIIPHEGKLDTYFIFSRTRELKKYGETNGAGSTFIEISGKQMESMPIINPEIDEQQAIGNYFQNMDRLINTSQTKLDKIKNIKKACLEKMFPRTGSTTPELRFKGFTKDWKDREVRELLLERNTQCPKSEEYPLMAFIAYEGVAPKGERYNRESLVNDELNKKYKQTEYGDFIYSSNNLETGSIGLNKYGSASISPVYSIFRPTEIADSDFIGRLLIRQDFINKMIKWRQGVIYGQWRIHESDFLTIEILAPSYSEQARIGIFFKHLDDFIAKTEQQINKLKNIKKACLDKMFVNRED